VAHLARVADDGLRPARRQRRRSIVIDGAAVCTDLAENEPEAAQALSTARSALFGGAADCLGSVFTLHPNCWTTVRLRLDDLTRFSSQETRWLPLLWTMIDCRRGQIRCAIGYAGHCEKPLLIPGRG